MAEVARQSAGERCRGTPEEDFKSAPSIQLIAYDRVKYDFASLVGNALGVPSLADIGRGQSFPLFLRSTDQSSPWHALFYRTFDSWSHQYMAFVREYLAPFFSDPFYVQAVPTFRIHLNDNVAVGEFHVDSDYGHPMGETTFWVPLTPAFATNSIWIESDCGRSDFRPVCAAPGTIVAFDGCKLRHGNHPNRTGQTRISFDFRCLRVRDYRPSESRSINSGLAFRPGGYYLPHPISPLP
jgi:hypothetical protein